MDYVVGLPSSRIPEDGGDNVEGNTVDRLGEPIHKPVKRVTFSSRTYFCRNFLCYSLSHEQIEMENAFKKSIKII